jgi:cytochrome c biogenesis protein CcmG/thiol:disulfide interchange protein DsbE
MVTARWMRRGGTARPAAGAAALLIAVVAFVLVGIGIIGALAFVGRSRPGPPPVASSFTLSLLGRPGQQITLADYQGRPVVINFFASTCKTCKTETPLLARFYRAEHGRVLVLGIDSGDLADNALAFDRRYGVTYPVGFDPHMNVAFSYGLVGLPETAFLNARHQIVRGVAGALTLHDLESWAAAIARKTS